MPDQTHSSLRILLMAAEAVPFAKTGEVAEVVSALGKALKRMGHDVRMAIPRYNHIDPQHFELQILEPFSALMNNHHELVSVAKTFLADSVPVYMVDNPRYFGPNPIYMHTEDAERFIFYCRATLEMLKRPEIDWQPDIIHCHDWQTALVPNWLATVYKDDPFYARTATVFTIHRLAHQGIFGYHILEVAGLEKCGFVYHANLGELADLVDLTARGAHYADAITTVSEHYAQEILTPEYGERLDPLLCDCRERLYGVRNGIDTETWDPAEDGHIASCYDARSPERRSANKAALQSLFGLATEPRAPVIGMISRLTDNKGLDLVTAAMDTAMANLGVQFAIMGIGEQRYHDLLRQYSRRYAGRVAVQLTFNEALEHKLYAGSDIFLMPSRVEPCGLGQMVAMRYGSVPIVRATGGLADTVHDYDPGTGAGNGFSFEPCDAMALYTAIVRAVESYKHRELWQSLQRCCMTTDFSWSASAAKYVEIYRRAMQDRALVCAQAPTSASVGKAGGGA